MEHLPIHLPYEARIAGPVQYRWMYGFERLLHELKKDVKNKAKVEGSICNAYLVREASIFCSHYFEPHVYTRSRKVPRNDDGGVHEDEENLSIFKYPGRLYGRCKARRLTDAEYLAAHTYILLNCEEVQPYIALYEEMLKELDPRISELELATQLQQNFGSWFENFARQNEIENKYICDLSKRPLRTVKSYPVYFVNGYRFHTESHGANKSTMNSGVCVSSTCDDYYGKLMEILEIEYTALPIKRTVLFKCEWYDPTPNVGVKVHDQYNLVEINQRRRFNKFEPFILAMQAIQVCFVPYPSMRRDKVDWLVVCKVQPRGWIESFKKENGQAKDAAFQEKEVEDTEIASRVDDDSFVRLSDENVEYIDIPNDNSDNEEENDELEFDYTSRPLSPSTPSTATNGQAGQDVVRQVHGRLRIDVKGNMLTNSDVCARKITKLFKERTDPNGYTWGQLSVDTVEFYWEEFKKSFDWDDAKTTLVYNAWEMKAKIRYADYISRLRKNPRPVYIPPEIWTKWNEVWNSEEGKKKTELAKKNRRGGVLNGVAQSTHTTGSTPHVKVAAQLEQVATQREVFTGTGEQVDDNQLYYDVVGGHDKKRRIYGLGSYGCSIVNGSSSDNTSGNMTPTSRPPDNATSASVQDEIQSLKATILLMQQRLDAIDGGRAGTSSSPPSQTD
nr:uncharacterized protein LOC111894883 [Ipomoea batatas]